MSTTLRTIAVSGLLTAAVASVGTAQTTLDFSGNVTSGTSGSPGACYVEDGFQLAAGTGGTCTGGFAYWGTSVQHYAGPAMFNNFVGGTTTLTQVGGGSFNIFSIALAQVFANTAVNTPVNFVGMRADATTVFQSFVVGPSTGGSPTFADFFFSTDFTNLVSLSWQQTPEFHQFDDIQLNVSAVPEPATLSLLATGLFGLAAARRRRKAGGSDVAPV